MVRLSNPGSQGVVPYTSEPKQLNAKTYWLMETTMTPSDPTPYVIASRTPLDYKTMGFEPFGWGWGIRTKCMVPS